MTPLNINYRGVILAVDQSLANAGWAVIDTRYDFEVCQTGNVRTVPTDLRGHADTLVRAETLYDEYMKLLQTWEPELVVHELPAVGGKMARPEASLVSATALHCAVKAWMNEESLADVPIHIVGAQRVKKHITGNGNAKKPEVKKALLEFMPELQTVKPFNEGIVDAIGLAIVATEERSNDSN